MKCVAIIQGRLGSSRLPAKMALDICGAPLLKRVVERASLAAGVDDVILATSDRREDDVTEHLAHGIGIPVFRGSLEDAQDRFFQAARWRNADVLIRLTADNPYVEPSFIEELIGRKRATPDCPYIVHDLRQVVHGTASELVDVAALEIAQRTASALEKEHITPAIRSRSDSIILKPSKDLSNPALSLSVDTIEDYVSVCRLYRDYGGGRDALAEIVAAFRNGTADPGLFRTRS